MIHDGEVKGLPLIIYRDTKEHIEALTGVSSGGIAYATDWEQVGVYNGLWWYWLLDTIRAVAWLSELSDVSIVDPVEGDTLEYNGWLWVNVNHNEKITANSVTLDAGTSGDSVADLQTEHDGNAYAIEEESDTPGIDLIVDFINVTRFDTIRILGYYEGSNTHSISVQLYNWDTTGWDTFDSMCYMMTMQNYDVWVPDDTNYIGTGADAGRVRVRFNHTMSGNSSHDLYLDVVALYK